MSSHRSDDDHVVNMNPTRVDSGVGLENYQDNKKDSAVARDGGVVDEQTQKQELQLYTGLGIILEYLNDGNSQADLERLRRQAEFWCCSYGTNLGQVRDTSPPQVMNVHPRLFDLTIPSYLRLDSPPPPALEADDGADSDVSDVDDSFRLPPSIEGHYDDDDDDDARSSDDQREAFPAYTEPVTLPDAIIYRVIEKYDEDHAAAADLRRTQMLRTIYPQGSQMPPGNERPRGMLPFYIHIRAQDLLGSPIIFHIPALVIHLSKLCVVTPAAAYARLLQKKRDEVWAYEAAQQMAAGPRPVMVVVPPPGPPPGLRSPIQMPRTAATKRDRPESDSECEKSPTQMARSMSIKRHRAYSGEREADDGSNNARPTLPCRNILAMIAQTVRNIPSSPK